MMKLRGTGKVFSIGVIVVIAIIAGLAVGYGLGYAHLQPQVNDLKASLAKTEESLAVTQANLDKTQMLLLATKTNLTKSEAELKEALQKLQSTMGELSTTQANLKSTKEELSTTQANLKFTSDQVKSLNGTLTQVKRIVSKLDNDRLLLIELRKDLPETRAEAKDYWSNVKRLAVKSDPALGPSVDKIIVQIDAYFDWIEAMPGGDATSEEILIWLIDEYFYVYAAYRYSDAIEAFQKEALLVVVTHIDIAVELIS